MNAIDQMRHHQARSALLDQVTGSYQGLLDLLTSDDVDGVELYDRLEQLVRDGLDMLDQDEDADASSDQVAKPEPDPESSEPDEDRRCRGCAETKPLDEFNMSGGGRLWTCKPCMTAKQKKVKQERVAKKAGPSAGKKATPNPDPAPVATKVILTSEDRPGYLDDVPAPNRFQQPAGWSR